jgi:hypothetical protein
MILADWISENTENTKVTVEFGSMFFDKLSHSQSLKKIGIEIHKPYIDRAKYFDCLKICGDFKNFEDYIAESDMDVAMFIDTLEHLNRSEAFELMSRVMQKFKKVILMIPEGLHEQHHDHFNLGADKHQTHRSTWFRDDVEALGFSNIVVDPIFHRGSKSPGCIFAVWEKQRA